MTTWISDSVLRAAVDEFRSFDFDSETQSQLEALIGAQDEAALRKLFLPRIAFGTAGLRARMHAGYACMNSLVVLQASQGLAKYVLANVPDALSRGVVVGYDARHRSRKFASITCQVFRSLGFKVLSFASYTCTPYVPFAVSQLHLACGVMVTASHNPKDDNGYKVYWENGPQIIPPHDEGIANMILDNVKPWAVPRLDESFDGCELVDDRIGDMYMASIASLCRFRTENPNRSLRIAYTPVHGVGAKFARRAFEVFGLKPFTETKEQIMPDPEFSTVTFPNPEEGATTMQLVVQTARANDCRLVLANDPDADRLAVAEVQDDGSVYFFNGNEIALLFADYVWQYGRDKTIAAKDSFMVASTVSSKILRRMGEVEGFAFHDTLTGFKYMGNKSQELVAQGKQFLFAFEVEIGFLVGDMSFDKDGVRTAACMAEFASMLDAQGERLLTHLRRLYDKYGYFYMIPSYYFCYDPQIMAKVCDACRYPQYIQSIGGDPVVWIRDLTVGYQSDTEGHKPTLPVSSASQFLQMRLQSGVDITIRNSGTEPKLKYYVEANGPTLDDAKRKAQVAEKALIEEVLQPAKYGLQPRK